MGFRDLVSVESGLVHCLLISQTQSERKNESINRDSWQVLDLLKSVKEWRAEVEGTLNFKGIGRRILASGVFFLWNRGKKKE